MGRSMTYATGKSFALRFGLRKGHQSHGVDAVAED